jgi:membrane protease YdiL (CAAX protease family)
MHPDPELPSDAALRVDRAADGANAQADIALAAEGKPALWITILRNPITRVLLFIALSVAVGQALRLLLPLPSATPEAQLAEHGSELWLRFLRGVVGTALVYWLLVRFVEGRRVQELRLSRLLPDAAKGWLVGTVILLAAAAAMAAVGALKIQMGAGDASLLAPLLVLGFAPGITEELIARGILLRVVEDGLGTWAALAISATAFGAAHLGNPNATVLSAIFIAIEAGLMLGMAYVWTRSLWFCMGLHAAWNFTQGAILGISVSGISVKGLLHSTPQGGSLLSGGDFGAEGSLLTVILGTCLAIWFARKAIADGRIVRAFWNRPRREWPASRAGVQEAHAAGAGALPPAATAADAAV